MIVKENFKQSLLQNLHLVTDKKNKEKQKQICTLYVGLKYSVITTGCSTKEHLLKVETVSKKYFP